MSRPEFAGRRYGRLTVLSRVDPPPGASKTSSLWLCACDCGGTRVADAHNLRRGYTQSCGCLQREVVERRRERAALRQAARVPRRKAKVKPAAALHPLYDIMHLWQIPTKDGT